MTIKELISELEKYDQDSKITLVGSIEHGRSLSWIEVEDCEIDVEEGDVYLKVQGDRDEDGGCD